MADQSIVREDVAPGEEAPVGDPVTADIEDDDAVAGDARHLAKQLIQKGTAKVMGELHGDDEVDRPIGERESKRIRLYDAQGSSSG